MGNSKLIRAASGCSNQRSPVTGHRSPAFVPRLEKREVCEEGRSQPENDDENLTKPLKKGRISDSATPSHDDSKGTAYSCKGGRSEQVTGDS